ncbi:hypothetical protein FHG64_12985 [Antarcticibacterium flavum]|uniref:Secreted protein n=1 Tax=Antarcticibacterium flavum TaxID=2058175 RepID=A0A5B7X6J5_9FLAO|nr:MULTISPECIES: hypothetical protein [Antarcticibacterium]MCM4158491.1 hypothetical protein [Antarcticibacterium sp. W02-3]QCY70243.1 hypothetical protein FHG64_12985 [Antarcticibacterium flavum]
MNLVRRKIAIVALALLVLFAPSSFAASLHFCTDNLVDIDFLGNSKTCHETPTTTDQTEKPCAGETNCCSLKVFDKKMADNFLKKSISEEDKYPVLYSPQLIFNTSKCCVVLEESLPPFKHYLSPTLAEDLQVLYEVYLI